MVAAGHCEWDRDMDNSVHAVVYWCTCVQCMWFISVHVSSVCGLLVYIVSNMSSVIDVDCECGYCMILVSFRPVEAGTGNHLCPPPSSIPPTGVPVLMCT